MASSGTDTDEGMNFETKIAETAKLLASIQHNLDELGKLLAETDDAEDLVYRFYHQSFKVYAIQGLTEAIVARLQALAPHLRLNPWFLEIVREGTGREFTPADNARWTAVTRPMLEAFFHARYFLEMVCRYGKELSSPPEILPSGWAAVLYLYNIR
jgi:hypothetical protein